jgi:hypothetical protein
MDRQVAWLREIADRVAGLHGDAIQNYPLCQDDLTSVHSLRDNAVTTQPRRARAPRISPARASLDLSNVGPRAQAGEKRMRKNNQR